MIKNTGPKCIIYLIDIYKYLLSPLLGNNCRFLPTCSEYTKDSILKFGLVKAKCQGLKSQEILMYCRVISQTN
jgi:putative membrane protein insertion efficiency factor